MEIFDIAYHSDGLETHVKDISRRQEISPRTPTPCGDFDTASVSIVCEWFEEIKEEKDER